MDLDNSRFSYVIFPNALAMFYHVPYHPERNRELEMDNSSIFNPHGIRAVSLFLIYQDRTNFYIVYKTCRRSISIRGEVKSGE